MIKDADEATLGNSFEVHTLASGRSSFASTPDKLAAVLNVLRPTAVVASHSPTGGRTWPAPATVAAPLAGNEQPAITASPTRAGHAYLAFANFLSPDVLPRTNSLDFSRTTDGGAAWSSPVLIDQPSPLAIDFASKILVLPDRTLLAVFARADFAAGLGQIYAARSPDEGRTWLPPVLAVTKPFPPDAVDDKGIPLPQPGFPSTAVAPTAASTSPSRTTHPRAQERSAWPGRGTAAAPGAAPHCRG